MKVVGHSKGPPHGGEGQGGGAGEGLGGGQIGGQVCPSSHLGEDCFLKCTGDLTAMIRGSRVSLRVLKGGDRGEANMLRRGRKIFDWQDQCLSQGIVARATLRSCAWHVPYGSTKQNDCTRLVLGQGAKGI